MNGAGTISKAKRNGIIAALLAFALLFRLIVPAGWMPVAGSGYAITLCSGAGAVSAWVDKDGVVHKGDKGSTSKLDHPCTFAGFSVDLATSAAFAVADGLIAFASAILIRPSYMVSVGHGLAAPPPPPTGPPATL